jgi:precorrin-6B methylase 2
MNKFLFPIYRILVPKPLRTVILKKNLRKKIQKHFGSQPDSNEEQKEILKYLENNEVSIFPYPFHANYTPESIEVFYDEKRKMRYVLQDGKRLYFKKRWTAKKIRKSYCDLMREQDVNSPHRYLTSSFTVEKGDILADIGAAEGNFSLDVIEQVDKVYLFEYDPEWTEALKATFEPWSEKVVIINKFVSDTDDVSHVRFDTFVENQNDVNFLKIDVDGAESVVLNSCNKLFKSGKNLKIALCTYHKNNDEIEFTALLKDLGFSVTPSSGYMINYYDKKMEAPYLRRGLLRAVRGVYKE